MAQSAGSGATVLWQWEEDSVAGTWKDFSTLTSMECEGAHSQGFNVHQWYTSARDTFGQFNHWLHIVNVTECRYFIELQGSGEAAKVYKVRRVHHC